MKKPSWVSIVGILLILFGVLDILGGAEKIMLPSMLEMQQHVMSEMSKNTAMIGPMKDLSGMMKSLEEQFQYPDWYKSWAVVLGLVSMLVAGLYLLSGIFLMMLKPFAIRVFYCAIALSIAWAVALITLYVKSDTGILQAQIPGALASIIIDIVLLIVVLVGEKDVFNGADTGQAPEAHSS